MGSFFNYRRTLRHLALRLRGPLTTRGFTLIEMLAVLAIIVVITGIAFTGQSLFNRTLTLANTAYDVALSIRQAENYGIASRSFGSIKNAGYGIHFDSTVSNAYYFYADVYPLPGDASNCHCANATCAALPDAKPGNCLYDASYGLLGAQSELVSQYNFGAGISIADFCGTDTSSGARHCAVSAPSDLKSIDVVFVRPNTQVTLTAIGANGMPLALSGMTLYLMAGGAERCVSVSAVGQVSVPTACP
jgi:prepilin-type N-terminal cleavage/methylation domain-containing protein